MSLICGSKVHLYVQHVNINNIAMSTVQLVFWHYMQALLPMA